MLPREGLGLLPLHFCKTRSTRCREEAKEERKQECQKERQKEREKECEKGREQERRLLALTPRGPEPLRARGWHGCRPSLDGHRRDKRRTARQRTRGCAAGKYS
mmetsp:Transcript_80974/g.188116  ORF Transcript_80974/g.188116 Transcript_80974/m.188116 type:complete len:104 (+) Transcript_80974:194-505(+)